jgi:4-amino-4-deoxy-L-arabinose transferase-like glycosyltransferase
MRKSLIGNLKTLIARLPQKVVFISLLMVSIALRFPFFFRDYIDRDESTFILMGQSWVNGHLPYTELWDLKPPITFLFFAGIIYVFGKSFLAIRFFGALLVSISAFFTYKIGAEFGNKGMGYWAALGAVALQSLFGSLQGVMSEHLCMALFIPGLFLMLQTKTHRGYLLTGLLMGMSIMTKLNIAYAVFFLGLYLIYDHFKAKRPERRLWQPVLFGVGIIVIVGLTLLPYYRENQDLVWWNSVIMASLAYAGSSQGAVLNLAPTFLAIALFFLWAWRKRYFDFKDRKVQLLAIVILGVLFSFAKAGRINSHYLIQLYPMLIVLVGLSISKINIHIKKAYQPILVLLMLMVPAESYLEYYRIVKNKLDKGTFYNGEGITVPQYLMRTFPAEKNIFFLEYHIGYWLLDATPPTKAATHPSNICREELFPFFENPRKTALDEITFILSVVRPNIVVTRKNRLVFDDKLVEENRYVSAYLNNNYQVWATVEGAEIYKRSD